MFVVEHKENANVDPRTERERLGLEMRQHVFRTFDETKFPGENLCVGRLSLKVAPPKPESVNPTRSG